MAFVPVKRVFIRDETKGDRMKEKKELDWLCRCWCMTV